MYYDEISKGYEELHGDEQREKLDFLIKHIGNDYDVLDVGCGTGIAAEYFSNYKGLDPSKELIKIARSKRNADVQVNNAENFRFEKKFSLIICITVAHHFENKTKALTNLKNHLKKEGILAVSLLKESPSKNKIKSILEENFNVEVLQQKKDTFYICKTQKFI